MPVIHSYVMDLENGRTVTCQKGVLNVGSHKVLKRFRILQKLHETVRRQLIE